MSSNKTTFDLDLLKQYAEYRFAGESKANPVTPLNSTSQARITGIEAVKDKDGFEMVVTTFELVRDTTNEAGIREAAKKVPAVAALLDEHFDITGGASYTKRDSFKEPKSGAVKIAGPQLRVISLPNFLVSIGSIPPSAPHIGEAAFAILAPSGGNITAIVEILKAEYAKAAANGRDLVAVTLKQGTDSRDRVSPSTDIGDMGPIEFYRERLAEFLKAPNSPGGKAFLSVPAKRATVAAPTVPNLGGATADGMTPDLGGAPDSGMVSF